MSWLIGWMEISLPMPPGEETRKVHNQAPGCSLDFKSYIYLKKIIRFLVFICLFCFARPDFILRLNGINRVVFPGDSFRDNHSQL